MRTLVLVLLLAATASALAPAASACDPLGPACAWLRDVADCVRDDVLPIVEPVFDGGTPAYAPIRCNIG